MELDCAAGGLEMKQPGDWTSSACAKFSIPYRHPMHPREETIDIDSFARRHIGPNEEEVRAMLRDVGFDSLGPLIDATVPKDIRL